MKCIIYNNIIKRVSDMRAAEEVARGWKYCTKTEWREFTKKIREAKKSKR